MSVTAVERHETAATGDRKRMERAVDGAIVGGLLAISAGVRVAGLAPSSLWLDDAWVALVARLDSAIDAASVGPTTPGFSVILWAWFRLVGFSSLAAQMLPWIAGVLGAAAVYAAARVLRCRPAAAAIGSLFLALSATHASYSVAVKQYTIDALAATLLLVLGALCVRAPDDGGRLAVLTVVGIGTTLVSASVVPVAVVALVAPVLGALLARRSPVRSITAAAAYAVVAGTWWLLVLRPRSTDSLKQYWLGYYIPDWPAARVALQRLAEGFAPLPWAVVAVVVVAAVGVVAIRRPQTAVLVAVPPAIATALAALTIAPLGTGRTDIYLYPCFALAIALGLEALPTRARQVGSVVLAVVLLAAAVRFPDAHRPYPGQDVRPLLARLESTARPDEQIIVYPMSQFAFSLYTSWPVELEPDRADPFNTGLRRTIKRSNVLVLDRTDGPASYQPQIEPRVAAASRVWVIASHIDSDIEAIDDALRALGFEIEQTEERPGALLRSWRRRS